MQDRQINRNKTRAILKHLQDGRPITNAIAARLFDCYRLGDVIYRLRKEGHEIDMVEAPNADGSGNYGIYRLMQEAVEVPAL